MPTATNTAAFEQEVNEFLAANLTPDLVNSASLGFGIGREEGTRWHKALFDKGWIAPDWPSEYGGCDWSTAAKTHLFPSYGFRWRAHGDAVWYWHGRSGDLHLRHPGSERPAPAEHFGRQHLVVPRLF